jgi:hypothetical protein
MCGDDVRRTHNVDQGIVIRRYTGLLVPALVALGVLGLAPRPSFAATTISDCPTTEAELSSDSDESCQKEVRTC